MLLTKISANFNFSSTAVQNKHVNKMIYGCEVYFKDNYDNLSSPEEDIKAVDDIAKIWAIVLPAMWW